MQGFNNMKRWYVIQVYAGYEETVKTDIEKRIEEESLQDKFGEILIPAAKLKKCLKLKMQKISSYFLDIC